MNMMIEWSDLQNFLELSRTGTLSEASRRLRVDITILSRSLDSLESQLRTTIIDRRNDNYGLTEQGKALLVHAESMETAARAGIDAIRCAGKPHTSLSD
jgi:DNA-binding transcriptional LysR family regulator